LFTRVRRGSDMAIFNETVALIALTLLAMDRNLEKEVFEYKGLPTPPQRGEAFRPLNPQFL